MRDYVGEINNKVKRKEFRRALAWLIISIVFVVAYLIFFLPRPVSTAQQIRAARVSSNNYVRLNIDPDKITTWASDETGEHWFFYELDEEQNLLITTDQNGADEIFNYESMTLRAQVTRDVTDVYEELVEYLSDVEKLGESYAVSYADAVLYIDQSAVSRSLFLLYLGLAALGAAAVFLIKGRVAVGSSGKMEQDLYRLGVPIQVRANVNESCGSGDVLIHTKELILTPDYLLYFSSQNIQAGLLSTREIVWAYKYMTQRRWFGIPVGRMYTLHVYTPYGKKPRIIAIRKEQTVDELLLMLHRNVPSAVLGYDVGMMRQWRQDRPGVLALWQHRKDEMAGGA